MSLSYTTRLAYMYDQHIHMDAHTDTHTIHAHTGLIVVFWLFDLGRPSQASQEEQVRSQY